MNRFLRWVLYVVGFFALLLALLYGIASFNKEKILEAINRELKTAINGDIKIGTLNFTLFENFPRFSIALSDIYLRGPRYAQFHQDFFNAEKIYVDLKLIELVRGTISLQTIRIKKGNVFIFRSKDGYINTETFKKKENKDSTSGSGFGPTLDVKKIFFENTRINYVDSVKGKAYAVQFKKTDIIIASTDSSKQISILGAIHFGGLMLNEKKGSYLSDKATDVKLNLEIFPGPPGMVLRPSELQFDKSTVGLEGKFLFSAPGSFVLNIHSPNLDYLEGTTIVTKALAEKLGKYQVSNPIDLTVRLDGSLAGGEPKIDIGFSTKANKVTLGKVEIQDMSFDGTFINHVDSTVERGDPNSRLNFTAFSGKISGIPTEGKVMITDLTDPNLTLESHVRLSFKEINTQADTTRLKFLSGAFASDVNYDGKLMEYLDATRTSYEGKLQGSVKVENASWVLPLQQKKFDNVNVDLQFTSKQMDIERINFRLNNSPVEIKGMMSGFLPYFFGPKKKGFVKLAIYSKKLDLEPLMKKQVKRTVKTTGLKGGRKISDLLDQLYEKIEFDLSLRVDELVKGPLRASKLSGRVLFHQGQLTAGPFKMRAADGDISFSLKMDDLDKEVNPVSLTANVKDADITKLFLSFNDFSQKAITSKNLSGKISTNVQLDTKVDDEFQVIPAAQTGKVDFKIKDGRISDFEPLQNMSNFLFKKRDFSDVKFAEINGRFGLAGQSLDIGRMEIQSSVLTLFLEGQYSLKDTVELSIQIPLSNLKKRDKDYKPENVGVDAKVGASVYLRVHKNKAGKIVMAYDPFKKSKKK